MSNETYIEDERDPDMDESSNCGLLHIFLCCFRRRRSRNPHRHNTDCNTYRYRQADGTFRVRSICNSRHQSASYVR